MAVKWEFSPELSYRWSTEIPAEIVRILHDEGEAACIIAASQSPERRVEHDHDCRIYIGTDKKSGRPAYLKKVYCGQNIVEYRKKFSKECSRMKKIKTDPSCRHCSDIFPKYYCCSTNLTPEPYVIMEYIPSEDFLTLERYLSMQNINRYSEQRLIDDSLFTSLIEKLHDALKILFQHNLLYLDLQPDNILINPATGEIRLVDFTDCYELNTDEKQSIKLADKNLDPNSPLAVLLTRAFCLLIARLHYAGDIPYSYRFVLDIDRFTDWYSPLFNDILCRNGQDPMEINYQENDAYRTCVFEMYEKRYRKLMDALNRGKFKNKI